MRDVLIHIHDFRNHTRAAEFGIQLAAKSNAAATAVYVCPGPAYAAPTFAPELLAAIMENTRELVREALQAGDAFVAWAASMGAARCQWLVAQGDTTDALVQAGTRHGLIVLDHGSAARDASFDPAGVILKAAVPCIVVPRPAMRTTLFARIAIGWNGSPEAMRALYAALPFLKGARVLLLRGEERDRYPGVQWNPPFDIDAYLEERDIEVERKSIDARPDEVGAALLAEAAKFRADLLVMGAYGRSRFSEWMLGGATRHVLARADIPVLLRH